MDSDGEAAACGEVADVADVALEVLEVVAQAVTASAIAAAITGGATARRLRAEAGCVTSIVSPGPRERG
jgi:hypothetical protein